MYTVRFIETQTTNAIITKFDNIKDATNWARTMVANGYRNQSAAEIWGDSADPELRLINRHGKAAKV